MTTRAAPARSGVSAPRWLVVLLLLSGFGLGGCSFSSEPSAVAGVSAASERLSVVATTTILGDLARDIGGRHVDVTTLVPAGGDPHRFEPAPSAVAAMEDADVVLANGLGLEPWFDALSGRAGDKVTVVAESASTPGNGRLAAGNPGPDPHRWMVPTIVAETYVPAILDALVSARPEARHDLEDAAARLVVRLEALDDELAGQLARIPQERRRLVTSHDAYTLFGAHYGFEIVGSVFGVSTEREPSAAELADLVDRIREAEVPTIFVETTIDRRLVERVARDAGVSVGEPLYGDSLGPPGSATGSYVGMMRANVDALVEGLGDR